MTINNSELRPPHRGLFSMFAWRATPVSFFQDTGDLMTPADGLALQRPVRLPVELVSETPAGSNDNHPSPSSYMGGYFSQPLGGSPKRWMDIILAATALLLAAPIMLGIAAFLRITTGGPALFFHNRVGFNGRIFRCYKFRTMIPHAEQALALYLASDPEADREWKENHKLKHDPRITFFGQMLRKSSLDELPQLFNILMGQMSCVGPRPVVSEELERYGDCAQDYLCTRPGLTGLWQVSGRSSSDYARRVALDSQYVHTWSIRADLLIMVWTVFAVLRFDQTS